MTVPYRPLSAEHPEVVALRARLAETDAELSYQRQKASLFLGWFNDVSDDLRREERHCMQSQQRVTLWKSLALSFMALWAISVASPFLARWWSQW